MASSSKLRIRPLVASPTLPKIRIKQRVVDDDATTDLTELEDDDNDEQEAVDEGEDGEEIDQEDTEMAEDTAELADPSMSMFTPRARGRPRGPGRPRGTGRPRGRPRGSRARPGSTRGGGRPPVWRPASNDRDTPPEGYESPISTPLAWEQTEAPVEAGGKPFRRIKGQVYIMENDELVLDNDDKGEAKIDIHGVLQGGRQFKAVTFTIPTRAEPRRNYMLAIDAARTSGFRDSLYFFRRNPLMLKLTLSQVEKEALIDAGHLSPHLRSRSVTMVTARSAFKLQGAKLIRDGRWVVDDYYEDQARADCLVRGLVPGEPVGELPDPQGYGQQSAADAAKAREKLGPAVFQGSIYKSGGPTTFFGGSGMGVFAADGEPAPGRARRPTADILKAWEGLGDKWMQETAQAVSDANESYKKMRMEALQAYQPAPAPDEPHHQNGVLEGRKTVKKVDAPPLGVYEPHSGLVMHRANTQSTRAVFELVPRSASNFPAVTGGAKAGTQAWGLARIDYVVETGTALAAERAFAAARHREVAEALAAEAANANATNITV